jgi:hypothetical protein
MILKWVLFDILLKASSAAVEFLNTSRVAPSTTESVQGLSLLLKTLHTFLDIGNSYVDIILVCEDCCTSVRQSMLKLRSVY